MRLFTATLLLTLVRSALGFDWDGLPSQTWVAVPTRGATAPKVFHGGATIAPERGEVFFFGSDTHEATALEGGETNAVWRLGLTTLEWSLDYDADPKDAFRVLGDGQCETTAGRPWPMHTFDAVEYDPIARRVVVVSFPKHTRFDPLARFPMFDGDWYRSLRPSHWEYDPQTRHWERIDTKAPDLFAQALAWDARENRLVGHDGQRTFLFDRELRQWSVRDAGSSGPGWHHTMVYDARAGTPLSFGRNGGGTDLYAYESGRWSKVDVEGSTLPAEGAAIAYDTRNGVMLYLANKSGDPYFNESGEAVTFIYESERRRWHRLDVPSPPLYGMNYLMQYDPVRNVVLHFERSPDSDGRLAVWAFRHR